LLTARALELAMKLKKRLEKLDYCMVLNADTIGAAVVFWVLPKGRDAKRIYADLEAGKLPPDKIQRYFTEVKRQFEKRERAMDVNLDARLSYTTNIGYAAGGFDLPAWKAVFFNPKTDESVIDRLIVSLDDL
jgi:L-2,4-diaminobutyrate decarboxylase